MIDARLKPGVRRGDVLVGGSPMRVARLRAGALADDIARGDLARRLLDANLADPVLDDVPPLDAAELTVVLPVHGRADQLDRALAALKPLRCLVVDDASPVPLNPAAEVIRLEENVGPAGARNAGLAKVSTPYVAFVDCDVTVCADTLLRLGRHFADPRVALVAPRIVGRARSERPRWFERYDEAASSLGLGGTGCSVRPGAAVAWLPSACLVGRTDRLVREMGGFDATMRVGEDVDLVWRLVDAGETVRYDPSEVAHHDARATLRGWLGRKYVYGTGGAPLAARHGAKGATAVLSPAMALGGAALLLRRWWSMPVALLCAGRGMQVLRSRLPDVPDRDRLAVGLSARGLWWSVRQESALLLRHWWPVAAVAAVLSPSVRRAVVTAAVVDVVVARAEHPEVGPGLAFAGRRLDDLAYGAGLWAGALRARSLRAVRPRGAGRSRPTGPATG